MLLNNALSKLICNIEQLVHTCIHAYSLSTINSLPEMKGVSPSLSHIPVSLANLKLSFTGYRYLMEICVCAIDKMS